MSSHGKSDASLGVGGGRHHLVDTLSMPYCISWLLEPFIDRTLQANTHTCDRCSAELFSQDQSCISTLRPHYIPSAAAALATCSFGGSVGSILQSLPNK